MEISKASRSPAWSIPVTVRVKRTWMTWWWSEAQQTNVTKRQRQNKDESWIKSFSLFTLNHKRNSAKKPSFFVFVESLFCFTWFLSTFSFNTFFFVHFSLHLFVHLFCFSLLFLFSHFTILSFNLCLCLCFSFSLWQRTKQVTKRNEWRPVAGMVTNVWKRSLLLACFWAWLKVWVGGPESTKENALADDFWLGLAAIVCFLWLSELCVTQTARGTSSGECLSSSLHVLSLHSYSPHVYPSSSTRGKKILETLGNLRRWGWT